MYFKLNFLAKVYQFVFVNSNFIKGIKLHIVEIKPVWVTFIMQDWSQFQI